MFGANPRHFFFPDIFRRLYSRRAILVIFDRSFQRKKTVVPDVFPYYSNTWELVEPARGVVHGGTSGPMI